MLMSFGKFERKLGLAARWVKYVLFAPVHFQVPLGKRLSMNLRGFTADQCALYNLDSSTCGDYLSEYDWFRSRWINEPFDVLLNNKVIFAEALSPYVKMAEILAVKNHSTIVLHDGSRAAVQPSQVLALIKSRGSVYKKPVAQGKGIGVHRFDFRDGVFFFDEKQVEEETVLDMLAKSKNWFISTTVEQGAFGKQLYDLTSNTIRLITWRDPKDDVLRVFYAVQRIGTSATIPVDNGSKGGLVCCIDLDTGELSEARSLQAPDVHEVHPDTGNQIKGMVVPDWDNVKKVALDLHARIPYLNFIAWDLLLTDEGVCVIEANTSTGVNIIQLWGPQKNGPLGDFYRAHGVLK